MKDIKLSKPIKEKNVDMGDNAKPEIYRTMKEIIDGEVTGHYIFMSQGYLLYDVEYTNLRTKKTTFFNKSDMQIDHIRCL